MAIQENINLDVDALLQTLLAKATNPEARRIANQFIRLILSGRTVTEPGDFLPALRTALKPLTTQLGAIMATLDQFTAALTRIDTATSTAAQVLTDIRTRVAKLEADAGISSTDEASVLSRLDGVAGALEAMGKTPENPVPTPVEPAPVEPTPETPAPAEE